MFQPIHGSSSMIPESEVTSFPAFIGEKTRHVFRNQCELEDCVYSDVTYDIVQRSSSSERVIECWYVYLVRSFHFLHERPAWLPNRN